jgi:hypothetical protein
VSNLQKQVKHLFSNLFQSRFLTKISLSLQLVTASINPSASQQESLSNQYLTNRNNSNSETLSFFHNKTSAPILHSHQPSLHVSEDDDDSFSFNESASSEDSDLEEFLEFKQKQNVRLDLATWAVNIDGHLRREDGDKLMEILRPHFPNLPKTFRTLKSTPRIIENIQHFEDGSYYHFGIEQSINNFFEQNKKCKANVIYVDFSTDGIPLADSSGSQLWPILGNIIGYKDVLFFGSFHGYSKPKNPNQFLQNFVEETNLLLKNNVKIENRSISLKLRCFVADSPAKSLVLYIKGHTGYGSCTKCTTTGIPSDNKNVIFPFVSDPLRTDQSFRNREQTLHHNSLETIELEKLEDFDCVEQVVIDYMHAALLGAMRQIMKLCIEVRKKKYSFSKADIQKISDVLSQLKLPSEFERQPRTLKEFKNFKANEFRNLLFYVALVIFKDIMPESQYKHFLFLFCAFRILGDGDICQNEALNNLAQLYLNHFVVNFGGVYDESATTFNIHCLCHIPNDVKNFGKVDEYSAFRFENYMQKLKKMVKKSTLINEQLHNRLFEYNTYTNKKKNRSVDPEYPMLKNELRDNCFEKVELENFCLSIKFPNNYCMIKVDPLPNQISCKKIMKIIAIKKESQDVKLYGKIVLHTEPYFKLVNLTSSFFNIVSSHETEKLDQEIKIIGLNQVWRKVVKIEATINQKHIVYLPFLH